MSTVGFGPSLRQNIRLVMQRRLILILAILLLAAFSSMIWPRLLQAQAETPTPAVAIPRVHKVADGENLTMIAQMYEVTVEDILAINNLANGDLLQVGQELIIPGGTGDIVATVHTVAPGDTLRGIAAEFSTSPEEIISTNRLIHDDLGLIVGQQIPVISRTGSASPRSTTGRPHVVLPGETLLIVAARHGLSPLALAEANGLAPNDYIYPGQRLRIPDETNPYRDLPAGWLDVRFSPGTIAQGTTFSVYIDNLLEGLPAGRFGDQPLQFAPQDDGFVALVGIDAFTEPGVYEMAITGGDERGLWPPLRLQVPVAETTYDTQYITVGEELSGLLDPELRSTEDTELKDIYAVYDDTRRWEGVFQMPVTTTLVTAGYGGRRSYNNGPIEIYHTGVDFAAPAGEAITAPANGVVVFADELELRGLTVIIDHGLGVMTGYYHLSEIAVQPGDTVVTGQPIGLVGNTGLSSGAHLHWDLRIMNVPVDALQWTQQAFP